jgi:protein TonB
MIQNILNFLKKLIPIDLDSMVLESSENESNVYQKYGVAAAAGTAVALFSLFIMAFLIATGEVQLDEIKTRKIVDIVMPQRDPELLDSVERPEEAEPEPEQTPPDVDIENIDDVLDDSLNLNFKFKAKKQGVFADGSYVPIFQVPPQYPRRAMERGIEGCVLLEYTVTIAGAVSEPKVIKAIPPNMFDRAATRAALRYKYKPLIRDGIAVPVEGVRQRITFVLESAEKGAGYIPENCRGQM